MLKIFDSELKENKFIQKTKKRKIESEIVF